MIEREVLIINKLGLHARAAAKFVKLASSFESKIEVTRQDEVSAIKTINGKSIMGVMMLAAGQGTELLLTINGGDELVAADQLEALIIDRFGEEE